MKRAGDGVHAELVNVGNVIGVSRGFAEIEQNALLVIFAGRRSLSQIRKNFADEEKMRAADQKRDHCYRGGVRPGMQSIEESATTPGKKNAENDGGKHKFDEQDGS
jgi:hypothetical protein